MRVGERVADLMQVIAKLTNECLFRARTGQEPSIGRQWIQRTKETKAVDEFTHEGIYGNHPYGFRQQRSCADAIGQCFKAVWLLGSHWRGLSFILFISASSFASVSDIQPKGGGSPKIIAAMFR